MRDWKDAIRERLAPAEFDSVVETDVLEELAQHLDDRYQERCAIGCSGEEGDRVVAELDNRDLLASGVHRNDARSLQAMSVIRSTASRLSQIFVRYS